MEIIFGIRKILLWFGLWGAVNFILGYALKDHIWDMLVAVWHGLGGA